MKNVSRMLFLFIVLNLGFTAIARADEDDLKHYMVRLRTLYVMPTEEFDNRLSSSKLEITNNVTGELDLEYYFTKYISAELIAGVTRHEILAKGGTVLGSTWLLPPSITVKYHPLPSAKISPYIGGGIELTFPFSPKMTGHPDFSVDQSIGWAAQTGVDIAIKDNLYFNLDYKYLNADTKFRLDGVKYKVDLNPHVFGVGVGYRF
jgi:outer membrane protein